MNPALHKSKTQSKQQQLERLHRFSFCWRETFLETLDSLFDFSLDRIVERFFLADALPNARLAGFDELQKFFLEAANLADRNGVDQFAGRTEHAEHLLFDRKRSELILLQNFC